MANKNFRVKHGLEVAGSATVESNLTVTGNLTVNGTTTTLNTENLLVEDNIVVLNSNVISTPTTNAGIEIQRGLETNSALTWNESDDKWYQNRGGTSTVLPVSTSELVEGTNLYYTDARVLTKINATSIDELSDVVITTAASGQMMYYDGTNWVNSDQVDSPNINRFSRTNAGTAANAIIGISRNRTDAARAVDGGPWLGFEYVGTDNTQATAPQNAIRSRYQTSGNHQLQFVQAAGSYNAITVMGQIQRGSTFFNTTGGVANLFLSDTAARLGGTTTTITNSANTQTYASLGATSGNINQDSFSIRNNAGTTTYGNFTSTGTTISGAGLSTVTRTTVGTPGSPESRPSMNIQLIRSDQATPNDNDGTSFRTRVGGSNGTFYTLSDINSTYKTSGDVSYNINLANGDQTGAAFSSVVVYSGSITSTKIKAGTASATPGASTVSDVAIFTPTNNTLRADAFTLTDYAGAALVGNKISYNRVYGQWQNLNTITPAAANTAYAFALPTTDFNNIATVASTSQITPGALGFYKTQFSVQVLNTDNAAEHTAHFWWRKNGTDIPGSMGRLTVPRGAVGGELIAGWDNMIQVTSLTDYWELMYAVEDVALTFPFYAATAFGPSTASLFVTLTPIGA